MSGMHAPHPHTGMSSLGRGSRAVCSAVGLRYLARVSVPFGDVEMKISWRVLINSAKVLCWFAACAVFALAFIVGAVWLADWRALPGIAGAVTLQGLAAPVTIGRDAHGIPIITAASEDDAYFALGYVHAQDRLFEMEMMRRQGQGRLAELVGRPGIGPDRFMLTLGVYRRAQADLAALDEPTRRAFARYAAGVNAWLAERHPLPMEFDLLQFRPEPWQPADSLVWQKLMGLQLASNWDRELAQAALAAKLGPERAAALDPDPRPDDAVTISQVLGATDDLRFAELKRAMTAVVRPASASNVWAVGGARTTTGKPVLANDPHLNFQVPGIWYFVGIDTPALKMFGATIPGVPLQIIGHNGHVAWGLTTTEGDTSDLFVEQTAGDSYVTPEGAAPFIVRTEIIRPRFNAPVPVTVRETHHGPVVSDIVGARPGTPDYAGEKRVLALAAAVLAPGDRSAQALYHMNHATDADSFRAALADFHAPQQNIMFADTAGGIGYVAAGRVPVRKSGDGTVPAPGWSGDYDWSGWIPFAELPQSLNPASGVLINANNKMTPEGYPHFIAAHWPEAYRANRIRDVIAAAPEVSPAGMIDLQQDTISLMARDLLPVLLGHTTGVPDRKLLDRLKAWDGAAARERWEPLVLAVWMERAKRRIFADELAELYPDFGGARPLVLREVLSGEAAWCDDTSTAVAETCDRMVSAAWTDTLAWLQERGLSNVDGVRWGDFHQARFPHILFGNFPLIGGLGALTVATPGDTYTVNRGTFLSPASRTPFRHVHGASLRAVYDLADLAASKFSLPGGQSGQMTSPHYGDLLTDWRDGRYFSQPTAATIVNRLTLNPPENPP